MFGCWFLCCCTYTYHLLMIQYEHIKPTFVVVCFVCGIVVVIVVPSAVRICIIAVFFFYYLFTFSFINICVYFSLFFILFRNILILFIFLCCVICLFAIKYHFDIIILIHNVYIYITSIKSIQTNQHFCIFFFMFIIFIFIFFLLSFHFLCLIRIVNVC